MFFATAGLVTYSEQNGSDAAGGTAGSLTWDFTNGVLTISGAGDMENYSDPSNRPWHAHETDITSAVIGSDVTSIGNMALDGCTKLTSIAIPNSVKSIGIRAFSACSSLKYVDIPDSVKSIGSQAFYECSSLESMKIPNGVTSISQDMLYSCSGLTHVDIPNSVTSIGSMAFYDCGSLESIDIPNSVKSIDSQAFYLCSKLASVIIPDGVASMGFSAFEKCASMESVTIPDSLTSIADYAFADCIKLKTVKLSNSAISIKVGAFWGCTDLESVTIPDSLTSIETLAFADCINLTSVTITGGLDSEGRAITNGVIDKYFSTGKDWILYQAPNAAKYLFLQDIDSSDYGPNDAEGIAGAEGRELHYKDAEFRWDAPSGLQARWGYTISGTLTVSGGTASNAGVTVSFGSRTAVTASDGSYAIRDLPIGISGNVTAKIPGYVQTGTQPRTSGLTQSMSDANITLSAAHTVTLTKGTGISGFTYVMNGGPTVDYTVPFDAPYGSNLVISALLSDGYTFDKWSGTQSSSNNPLSVSGLSGSISLMASGISAKQYVTFDSGSDYRVYVDSSLVTQPIAVAKGGSLIFSVQVSEGYTVHLSVSGDAGMILQTDGLYRISDMRSDVHVSIAVQPDGSGDGSGSGSGSGSGWAVINLICAIIALSAGIIAMVAGRSRRAREGVTEKKRNSLFVRIVALLIGAVSVIMFLLTENIGSHAGISDTWTPLYVGLLIVGLVLTAIGARPRRD
ncbi:MAG: leucine-rich repeat domain-containing protein [Candidatus Methanoplasma sp.]|nr:leucine-rich repeat domain-containing protein [Candidatus Methanoplasma sp.]